MVNFYLIFLKIEFCWMKILFLFIIVSVEFFECLLLLIHFTLKFINCMLLHYVCAIGDVLGLWFHCLTTMLEWDLS